MSEGLVVEIRRGSGEPRYIELTRGSPLQPLGVGLRADWRIEANGVLDVHAFLYFDGQSLFVQSADAKEALRVNGRVVPTAWTPVEPPCTLAFGDARLVFCPLSQATAVASPGAARMTTPRPAAGRMPARSAAAPPPAADDDASETIADVPLSALASALPASAPARPAAVRPRATRDLVAAHDEEATSNIPLPGQPLPAPVAPPSTPDPYPDDETTRALPLPAIAPSMPLPRPVAPIVAPQSAPQSAPQNAALAQDPAGMQPLDAPQPAPAGGGGGGPIAAPPPAAPVVEKPSPLATLKAQWKEASLPKRAILVLLPFAFVAVAFGLDDSPSPAPAKKPSTAAVTNPSSSADLAPAAKPEPKKPEPKAIATEVEDLAEAPAPAKTVAPAEAPKPEKPGPPPGGKTLERAAVDAVAAGAWLHAAELYTQLANEHPEVPAYREAARILRAKAKK